jgi:hypothetical protein
VQRTQGRMRHTEMKTNVQWATTWTIRDGKVLRAYGYLTRAEALETAGLAGVGDCGFGRKAAVR